MCAPLNMWAHLCMTSPQSSPRPGHTHTDLCSDIRKVNCLIQGLTELTPCPEASLVTDRSLTPLLLSSEFTADLYRDFQCFLTSDKLSCLLIRLNI